VLPAEIDEGGTHFAAISDRIVVLSLMTSTPEHASETAEAMFGPKGALAPGFLMLAWGSAQPRQ
jgi:hypothetical protein